MLSFYLFLFKAVEMNHRKITNVSFVFFYDLECFIVINYESAGKCSQIIANA